MTNNEGIIFINCPNCGESLEINSQQAEEMCPICKSPLDIQTLVVAEPQPTRKDKIKELLGRNLNSYHTKAKQLLTDIEKKNKEQNHKISVLTNKLDNDYLTKTEEGSVISLDYSKEGMVYLDELQGNTMVNYCTDGSKELTLNGDIDIEGTFVTTTEGVDNGLVDVICEGHTAVNISKTKSETAITYKFADIVGNEGVLENSTAGHIEIEKVTGNTLVNILDTSENVSSENNEHLVSTNWGIYNISSASVNNHVITITSDGSNYILFRRLLGTMPILKTSTTYTLVLDVLSTDYTGEVSIGHSDKFNNIPASNIFATTGIKKILLTTTNDFSGASFDLYIYFKRLLTGTMKFKIYILEGDYTDKPIPSEMFAGLQSSFEENLVTQEMIAEGLESEENLGKYRVPVRVVGKNLIKPNFIQRTGMGSSGNGLTYPNMIMYSTARCATDTPINVKPNTTYAFNQTNLYDYAVIELDNDMTQILDSGWSVTSTKPTHTTSNRCKYIVIIIKWASQPSLNITIDDIVNVQLEENTIVTDYEEYFERTANVYLNSPLLENDEIVMHNGELCHYHKYEEKVFDGSVDESWTLHANYNVITSQNNIYRFQIPINNIAQKASIIDMYCDKLQVILNINSAWWDVSEHIEHDDYNINVTISSSKLSTIDATGYKAYLQSNPIKVVYPLAEPHYEPIQTDKLLLECTNNSTLYVDTIIPTQLISFKSFEEEIEMLEPNVQYRVSFKCDKQNIPLNIILGGTLTSHTSLSYNTLLITTPAALADNKLVIDGQGCNISECVITKGDIEYPYFEGMKSVGQDDINGHKVEILSNSANILDKNLFERVVYSNGLIDYSFIQEIKGSNIEKDITYYFRRNKGDKVQCIFYYLDENKKPIQTNYFYNCNINYKIENRPSNSKYYQITIRPFGNQLDYNDALDNYFNNDYDIRINMDTWREYTPYKIVNKKEISLNEPLRSLPNGIKDRFIKIGGKWYIERNCREITLNGSENWTFVSEIDGGWFTCNYPTKFKPFESSQYKYVVGICDIYNFSTLLTAEVTSHKDGIIWYNTKADGIRIRKVSFNGDINSLKTSLADRNVHLIAQLVSPVYELITDSTLTTYLDFTHISNDSLIPCNMTIKNSGYNTIIKPSTQYTIALDTNKSGAIGCNLGGTKGVTTNNVLTLTTPAILADDSLRIYGKGIKGIKGSKIRLLEGDRTNWIPSFFEGMKSSFEDKVDTTDNTYKMEILSNNKNLFDRDKAYYRAGWGEQNYQKYKNGFSFYSKNGWNSIGYAFESLKNKTVTVCATVTCVNKDTSKQQEQPFSIIPVKYGYPTSVGFRDGETKKVKFNITLKDNGRVYFIGASNNEGSHRGGIQWLLEDISVVEGIENDYVPREYNKIQFSSIEPLRGVDNVKDRFIFKDGKLMIERNCDEVILNGSENWRVSPVFTQLVNNRTIYYDFPTADKFNNNKLNGLCNKFKVVDGNNFVDDTESIVLSTTWWDITKRCSLRVQRSKLSSTNLNSFKEWLSENPIKVVYELAEPIYEEIPYELQKIILEGYENGTLFFDTNIPPTATVTYAGEAPIVSAVKSTRTNVLSNTDDINDNIVPYLMDMDYRVVCLQLADNTESISVARLLGSTYEMLQRDIQSRRYPVDEYKHRLDAYLEVRKITEEEYIKLGEMLNE